MKNIFTEDYTDIIETFLHSRCPYLPATSNFKSLFNFSVIFLFLNSCFLVLYFENKNLDLMQIKNTKIVKLKQYISSLNFKEILWYLNWHESSKIAGFTKFLEK